MKNLLVSLCVLLLTAVDTIPLSQYYFKATSIQSVTGIIIAEDMETIEILPAKDKYKSIIITVTSETYIADAVNGKPASLYNRKDDKVVAYYQSGETGDYKAAALIINIPEDYSPPVYVRAKQVIRNKGRLNIITDSGVFVSISKYTPIEPFLTRNAVSVDDLEDNMDLLLWNQALTMSIPARTAAKRVVILGKAKPGGSVIIRDYTNSGGLWHNGRFPQITGIHDAELQYSINQALDGIYEEASQNRASRHDKLEFSYDVTMYKDVYSVIIHYYLFTDNAKGDCVRSIVFNTDKILTLIDVLGAGAYDKAEAIIRKEIDKTGAGKFFKQEKGFRYVTEMTSFFIDTDGKPVLIFDKRSIAPEDYGTPMFKIYIE